MSDKNRTGSLP